MAQERNEKAWRKKQAMGGGKQVGRKGMGKK